MVALLGTYENGYVRFDKELSLAGPVKVIITFLEEVESNVEKRLTFSDFSFNKSRNALSNYKGSFSDTLIEERRSEK